MVDAGANGWFELAPASAAIETLGAASALSLTNLTGITAGTLRIGAVTLPASPAPFVSATSIAVAGTFNAASIAVLDLEATGTISQATTAPIINLASLIASTNGVPGDIVLADTSNVIGTIGNIGVTAGNFVFGDTPASGTFAVSSGQMIFANNVSMTIVGTLAVNGAVTAAGTPGDVSLSARGPVADLIVGTGASLAAKGTMSVASDQDVMQSGGVINGGAVTVTAGGLLSLGATVSGAAIGLTGANIAIAGSVTDGGAGTVGLFATGGTISETGTLIAGTLTGSSTGAATLAGATPVTNLVTSLGSFLAPGFLLNDGTVLTVTGTLNGGTSAAITDSALLTVSGAVSATAVSLRGTALAIMGQVSDGGTGTVGLIATSGTVDETGTLVAGTLSGSATGATTLLGATPIANQVARLGGFTAAGFTLNDGESLTASGVINGGTAVTINDAGLLTLGGTTTATAVSLSGTALAIPGLLTDGGAGTVALMATGGTIDETGTLVVGTLSGSSTGATTLTGATVTTNKIATIATFNAAGLTLNDGLSLLVAGSANGGTAAAIADSASLTVDGTVSAVAVILSGANVTIPGLVTDGGAGSVGLIATSGTISQTGTLVAGTLSGNSTGATSLTGATATTNQVAVLGGFTAAGFTLNDGKSLTVAGSLSGGAVAAITDSAMLTIDGAISAAAVSLTGASVTIAGLVTDGGTGTVNLIATGGTIDESGTLVAGTLSGGATGTATLTGAMPTTNQIATVGSFSAAGITVNDGTGLAVAGLVNGGAVATITDNALLTITGTVFAASVALTGANVAIPGLVSDGGAGTVGLIATSGTINEPGTLIAGTLTGRSTGATTLTGATPITNQVAMLGGFTADGFLLNDGEALSVAGTLNGGEFRGDRGQHAVDDWRHGQRRLDRPDRGRSLDPWFGNRRRSRIG